MSAAPPLRAVERRSVPRLGPTQASVGFGLWGRAARDMRTLGWVPAFAGMTEGASGVGGRLLAEESPTPIKSKRVNSAQYLGPVQSGMLDA